MTEPVTVDRDRIRLGGLLVYLERVPRPSAPLAPGVVPPPHGVAPTALSADGEVLAAVGENEAIWLGFQTAGRLGRAIVRIRVDSDQPLDAVTGEPWNPDLVEAPRNYLAVPPDSWLVGVPGQDGIRLLTAPSRLDIFVGEPPGAATVNLLRPADFERLTGRRPAPLDPGSAYTGWRAL